MQRIGKATVVKGVLHNEDMTSLLLVIIQVRMAERQDQVSKAVDLQEVVYPLAANLRKTAAHLSGVITHLREVKTIGAILDGGERQVGVGDDPVEVMGQEVVTQETIILMIDRELKEESSRIRQVPTLPSRFRPSREAWTIGSCTSAKKQCEQVLRQDTSTRRRSIGSEERVSMNATA